MTRRPKGSGRIRPLPSGRWRITVVVDKREVNPTGETYATEEDADRALAAVNAARQRGEYHVNLVTLGSYGAGWIGQRKTEGYEAWPTDRSRWNLHVATAAFYEWPIDSITRPDVREWIGKMKRTIGDKSVREVFILARSCFEAMVEDELIARNPLAGMKLKRKRQNDESAALDDWTYLSLAEQHQIEACDAPEPLVLLAMFAYGTGLRQSEQMGLQLTELVVDGDDPHVLVRRQRKKNRTKTGKVRRVPLFGVALRAIRRWLEWRPFIPGAADSNLVFPLSSQWFRRTWKGEPIGGFGLVMRAAKIAPRPHLNWKALRHTCASALVSGMWGDTWELTEVRELLGHTSIQMTQRYAHLAPTRLRERANRTSGGGNSGVGGAVPSNGGTTARTAAQASENADSARAHNPKVGGSNPPRATREIIGKTGENIAEPCPYRTPVDPGLRALAEELIEAASRKDRRARQLARQLAEAVASADDRVRLVEAVRAGGRHQLVRALELARLIIAGEVADQSARGGDR